jgi:hypothetical protein
LKNASKIESAQAETICKLAQGPVDIQTRFVANRSTALDILDERFACSIFITND